MSGSDLPNLENLPPLLDPALLLANQMLLVRSRIRLRLRRTANKVTASKIKKDSFSREISEDGSRWSDVGFS